MSAFKAMGKTVKYKGQECKVIGFAPASKVNCGTGFALLLAMGERTEYVNTKEIESDCQDI